jgi:TolB-like protein/DNA-binding winged helix-turn-helix (wHTH) protein/tetratricopeptide (TPR) repeat protein
MNSPSRSALFGPFELNLHSGELRKSGLRVKMGEQAFQILCMLLEFPGDMVTREQLRAKLWPQDTFVDFDHGLNSAVQRLRDSLSDSAASPRWIETVPRRGYRFVGEVKWSDPPVSTEIAPPDNRNENQFGGVTEPRRERMSPAVPRSLVAAFNLKRAGIPLLAVFGVLALLPAMRGNRSRVPAPAAKPAIHSIAVLPLENLSPDPAQEYFADGMTDELTTMLAKNQGLRVISRTSSMQYKKIHRPLPEIARELGVEGILEGSVERANGRVHVNVQLVHAPSDTHLWAESYDRNLSDVGPLQSELAQTIAKQIGVTISPSPAKQSQVRPEARDAYMMGRYYWYASTDASKAREFFQKAIDFEPNYAAAWSGLADSYLSLAIRGDFRPREVVPQGEAAARKALMLDELSPEAHNSMAAAHLCRWDLQAAERESARALELNPNFAEGHHLRGYILQALNRLDEGLAEQKIATGLDPVARPGALVNELIRARQFDAALSEARLRSSAQPDNASLHHFLADAYFYKGMEKDAAREYQAELELRGDKKSAAAVQREFQRGGLKAVFEWGLIDTQKQALRRYVSPLELADSYACIKRRNETLNYLEKAYEERAPFLIRMQNNPDFDFLHADPRYLAIVKKLGLPQ